MERDIDKINVQLADAQLMWYEKICRPWMSNDFEYSQPFFTALLHDYKENRKLVMIIGQETNGYGDIKDFDSDEDEKIKYNICDSQKWVIEHLEYNLSTKKQTEKCYTLNDKKIVYDNRPFFKSLRGIAQEYNVCWNNIDKITYHPNAKRKKIKLTVDDERKLNKIIDTVHSTLLLKEIEIIKPDIIVFAIGPKYKTSLATSLCLEEKNIVDNMPNDNSLIGKKFFINIDETVIPCYWTYHPYHFQFKKTNFVGKLLDVLKKI